MVQIFKNQNRSVLNSGQLPPDPFQLLTNNKNNKPTLSQNGLLNAELPTATTGSNLLNQPKGFASSTPGRAFATAIGQASGYSDRPVSFTEVLSQGMAARNKAQASQAALEQQKFNDNRTYNLAVGEAYTNRIKALNADGRTTLAKTMEDLHPNLIKGSPEYLQEAMKIMNAGSTKFGQSKSDIVFTKQHEQDLKTVQSFFEIGTANRDLTNAYENMEAILESNPDFQTGPLSEAFLPVLKVAVQLGLLNESERKTIDQLTLLQAFTSYVTPRMRPVGSGASSDFEQKLYGQAGVQIGNSRDANLLIVKARSSYSRMNEDFAAFADEFLRRAPENFSLAKLNAAYDAELFADRDRFERIMGTKNIFDNSEAVVSFASSGQLNVGDVYYNNDTESVKYGTYQIVTQSLLDKANEVEKDKA